MQLLREHLRTFAAWLTLTFLPLIAHGYAAIPHLRCRTPFRQAFKTMQCAVQRVCMKKQKHPKILIKTREKHRNAGESLHNRKVVGDAMIAKFSCICDLL